MEEFSMSYRDIDPVSVEILQPHYEGCKKNYELIDEIFRTKKHDGHPYPGEGKIPEEDADFLRFLKKTKKYAEKIVDGIKKYDAAELDISKEKPKKPAPSWRFLSFNDIRKFWKDTMQDVQDMYTRRQDAVLKQTGRAVTYAVRNSGIRYASSLWAYHERRYSGTETEAADKWKKGLENEDTHSVLDMLGETNDKDQMRGGIALLCSRGEMDWNNAGVWRNLSRFANIDMPEGPCKRSDYLRDIWLKKLITKIYDDRELYYHFRTENDGKIKSGKESFTATVDQLSNISGAMHNELEKQLRLQVECHRDGIHPPEDVKPHLYEQIIHYAIKNGKMTMEDKFFYLVQGVRHHLLSIDRLRTLAGETGGVLQIFPAIDYFYQKNNSMEDIERIGKRLQESGNPYSPGIKTTLWLQLEVMRDEGTRTRLSKGSARVAEGIDHEDIPHFITQLDYKEMENLANVISGSRQKVTPQGWQNAYAGFNSKMKIFAFLLKLDRKGVSRFTAADARHLAQVIGTYIHMDNILTRNGVDNPATRPELSQHAMSQVPPSSNGQTTGGYRTKMNEFVGDLLFGRGKAIGDSINLDTKYKTGGKKTDGTDETKELTLADYAPQNGDYHRGDYKRAEMVGAVFKATPDFVEGLTTSIMGNLDLFERILESHADNFGDMSGSEVTQKQIDKYIAVFEKK
jgi:hypothetical protein